jgi:hypothetical protein
MIADLGITRKEKFQAGETYHNNAFVLPLKKLWDSGAPVTILGFGRMAREESIK